MPPIFPAASTPVKVGKTFSYATEAGSKALAGIRFSGYGTFVNGLDTCWVATGLPEESTHRPLVLNELPEAVLHRFPKSA